LDEKTNNNTANNESVRNSYVCK